jgi:8-oxo-dGTP diphosphatase
MKCRPSVLIFRDNCLLTMRYLYGDKEIFALPGGNPDPNECLTSTLERELQEELGISVEVGELAICGEVLWADLEKYTLHLVYLSKITEGTPVLNPAETTALDIVWLPVPQAAGALLYPNVGQYIQDLFEGTSKSVYIGPIDQPFIQ